MNERTMHWKLGPSEHLARVDFSDVLGHELFADGLCQHFETYPLLDAHGDVEQVRAQLIISAQGDIAKFLIERCGEWQTLIAATCSAGALARACRMWDKIIYRDEARREAITLANEMVGAARHARTGTVPHIERDENFATVYFPAAYVNGELITDYRSTL